MIDRVINKLVSVKWCMKYYTRHLSVWLKIFTIKIPTEAGVNSVAMDDIMNEPTLSTVKVVKSGETCYFLKLRLDDKNK